MILIIRGHIRNSFDTKELYDFVEILYNAYPKLKIFVHTWNIFANNISWRNININNQPVSKDIIYNYFGKLSTCIKHIIIDDDKNIQLHGNLDGKINNGLMPILGWKNYWYGKYKIIDYIYNQHSYHDEVIVNTRFDLLNNSNTFDKELIINFVNKNSETKLKKNVFLLDMEENGIDNIYIGNITTMYKLTRTFFYELDNILSNNNNTIHQERLVYRINNSLFD